MLRECVLFEQVLRAIQHPVASAAVPSAGPGDDVEELTCFAKRQGNDFTSVVGSWSPKRKAILVAVDALRIGAFNARGTNLQGACAPA
jgi:hypothetical protein